MSSRTRTHESFTLSWRRTVTEARSGPSVSLMHQYRNIRPQYQIYQKIYRQEAPKIAHELSAGQKFKKNAWHLFKCILPYLLLLLYSLFGGLVFHLIEGSNAVKARENQVRKIEILRNETSHQIANLDPAAQNISAAAVAEILEQYALDLGLQPQGMMEWGFAESVFFASTVYTTIGYGNMSPITKKGKIFTIFYAIGGIPLVLYTLADLGKLFCVSVWKSYTMTMIFLVYKVPGCGRWEKYIGEFPVTLALAICAGWILFCSFLFCQWEKGWDYFTANYFFFQSLTTIGFGDVTPQQPVYMLFSFVLVLIGLAMVSMCWNLIQIKMEILANKIRETIAETLVIEEDDEAEKEEEEDKLPQVKKGEEEVQKLASQENTWLTNLMSGDQKRNLAHEYEKKAAKRNRGVQATTDSEDKETTCVAEFTSSSQQTAPMVVGAWMPVQSCPGVDVETFLSAPVVNQQTQSRGTDMFRSNLQQLGDIISDCREIMRDRET